MAFVETDNVNAPEMVQRIVACRPEVIVVIAFGQKIGKELVALPPKGAINVHASLLPKYRGAAPINWAIVRGETHTGVSIITLADKIDAGDILAQARTEIGPQETAGELHDRLAQLVAPLLLLETLAALEAGAATYTKQNDAEATFAPKLQEIRRLSGLPRAGARAGPQDPGLLALARGHRVLYLGADAQDDPRGSGPGGGRARIGCGDRCPWGRSTRSAPSSAARAG